MSKDEIIARQAAIIAKQTAHIAELEEQLPILKAGLAHALQRVSELEAELNSNSGNSSRPPSSDGLKKKPAFPRKKGGKRGGQHGHKGKSLQMVSPDQVSSTLIHPVIVQRCACGHDLRQVQAELSDQRRQVFDLPEQLLAVTEHRIARKSCPCCGQKHLADFPKQVAAPCQYGQRVKALVTMLSVEQSMPVGRIGELFASLTGYRLNENTVVSTVAKIAGLLKPAEQIIKDCILSSAVAHADESGARVAGRLHWVHNLVTQMYTYFFVHEKRGGKALYSDQSITKDYKGILVHDCWASYFGLDVQDHALCGAHLLRELKGLADNHQRTWAGKMHDLLMYTYHFSDAGKSILDVHKLKIVRNQYRRIIEQADKEEPPALIKPKGKPKKTKGRNLMDRLKKYEQQVFNFALLEQVPFTNNQAERDIRPWKTKLKVSGCFRTMKGAQHFATIKGFCSTAKKHGLSVYQELINAINGESFLNNTIMAT